MSSKLKKNAVAFIHYSNLGNYLEFVENRNLNTHWRGRTVTAEKVKTIAVENNLKCISQELFNWGNRVGNNIDCFSVFTQPEAKWNNDYSLIQSDFKTESNYLKNLSTIYSTM